MSDSYQAIYDAVRSRISNGDVGSAIEEAMRNASISFYVERATQFIQETFSEYSRPSIMLRPALSIDGDMWCALYGESLQDGVAGFGSTPAKAFAEFDRNFYAQKTALAEIAAEREK